MTRAVLNVGGGKKGSPIPTYFDGWRHDLLDIDPLTDADIIMDARNLASLPAAQYDAIFCSHNIEHYYAHDVPKVLAGFRHVLTPDGFAEIKCPDIGVLMASVVGRGLDIEDTLYESTAGPVTVRDIIYGFGREIEQSGVDFYAHKTGFTKKSMERALSAVFPFVKIINSPPPAPELRAVGFCSRPTLEQFQMLGLSLFTPHPVG